MWSGERRMKKGRFMEEQIIRVLKQNEAGIKAADLCREHGISEAMLRRESKYGGRTRTRRSVRKAMEDENRRLKRLVADPSLDQEVPKAVIRKAAGACPG